MTEAELPVELRALGHALVVAPPADDLSERVLARVAEHPASRRRRRPALRRRRRLVAVIVAAVLVALVLTPPVRAAVLHWLRLGGVIATTSPSAVDPSTTPDPVPGGRTVTLTQARSLVDFPLGVPAGLGNPDRVTVSADGRVAGMDWTVDGRPVHLDQFDGELSWIFLKRTREPFEVTAVSGRDAIWFGTAHEIAYVDADGREHTEDARISGPTLVWERGRRRAPAHPAAGGRAVPGARRRGGGVGRVGGRLGGSAGSAGGAAAASMRSPSS